MLNKGQNSVIDPHVMDKGSSYVTNTFFLRHTNEEIKIDEFCQFTCEFPLTKDFKAPIFHLKAELMHASIRNQGVEKVIKKFLEEK